MVTLRAAGNSWTAMGNRFSAAFGRAARRAIGWVCQRRWRVF